jgi:archaemetzincin
MSACGTAFNKTPVTIVVQPYDDIPVQTTTYVYTHLKQLYANVRLAKPISMPKAAFYKPRQRHKALGLIDALAKAASDTEVILGITCRDVSLTRDDGSDWGIMGLAYQPGSSCVVSGYRLHKTNLNEEFFKVVLHEIGHTRGIRHCSRDNCFMRPAEGRNVTAEVHIFCQDCNKKLEKAGMKFAMDSL